MKKLEKQTIKYVGYSSPENEDELEVEVLGLETAIQMAKQRIAILKQSLKLQKLIDGKKDEKNIKKAD